MDAPNTGAGAGGVIFIKRSKPVRHLGEQNQNHSRIPRARAMRPVRNRSNNNANKNHHNPLDLLSRRSRNLSKATGQAQVQAAQPNAVVLRPPALHLAQSQSQSQSQAEAQEAHAPMSPGAPPPSRVQSSDQSFDSAPSHLTLSPEALANMPMRHDITLPIPDVDLEDAIVLIESDDDDVPGAGGGGGRGIDGGTGVLGGGLKRADYLSLSDGSTIRSDSPPALTQSQSQPQGQTRRAWELGGVPAWAPAKDENESTLESTARRRAELWVAMGARTNKKKNSPGSVRQLAALWETRHSPIASASVSPPSPPAVLEALPALAPPQVPLPAPAPEPEPGPAPISLGARVHKFSGTGRAVAAWDADVHYGYHQKPRVTGYWEGDERSTPALALRRVALQTQEHVSAPAAAWDTTRETRDIGWGGVGGTSRRGRPLPRTVRARRGNRRVRTDVTPSAATPAQAQAQAQAQEDVSLLHDDFVAFQTRPTRRRRAAARILSNLSATSASATTGSEVIASVTPKSSRGWRAALRRARLLSRLAS